MPSWLYSLNSTSFARQSKHRGELSGARIVRELYYRNDVDCSCDHSHIKASRDSTIDPSQKLSPHTSHYAVPMASTLDQYFDVLDAIEAGNATGLLDNVLILGSVMDRLRSLGYTRTTQKVEDFLSRSGNNKRITYFPDARFADAKGAQVETSDEYHKRVAAMLDKQALVHDYSPLSSGMIRSLVWIRSHMLQHQSAPVIPLVIITENLEFVETLRLAGFKAVSCCEYLQEYQPGTNDPQIKELIVLADSILATLSKLEEVRLNVADGEDHERFEHWTEHQVQLERRKENTRLVVGTLEVSRSNPQEAYVRSVKIPRETGTLETGDLFVPTREFANRAVHGDSVACIVLPIEEWQASRSGKRIITESDMDGGTNKVSKTNSERNHRNPTGRVVRIMKRNWRHVVASLSQQDTEAVVKGNSNGVNVVPMDIRYPKIRVQSRRNIETLIGQRFVVAFDEWPASSKYPMGHYIRTLGPIGDLATESSALLLEAGLEAHERPFSLAALACLPKVTSNTEWRIPAEELVESKSGRRDLRGSHNIISVDPIGCQDIDDTMSFRLLEKVGKMIRVEVGVHIADVTYFVTPGTSLDREASARGTSVYLQERRLDMLPRLLSEDLCSLRSKVDRLAMSVLWVFEWRPENPVGTQFKLIPEETWFGRTVIRSKYALAYEQAQRIIVGEEPGVEALHGAHTGGEVLAEDLSWLKDTLSGLTQLARERKMGREQGGGINLEGDAEFKFVLNGAKRPEEISGKEHLEVHDVIAEMMIFANEQVAQRIVETFPTCALLRRHPKPSPTRFGAVHELCEQLNIEFDPSTNFTIGESLKRAQAVVTPDQFVLLNGIVTRAMSEATYFCTGEVAYAGSFSHFGLGIDFYTHFTSPIRRYPDVVVHRLLLATTRPIDPLSTTLASQKRKGVAIPESLVADVLGFLDPNSSTLLRAYMETAAQGGDDSKVVEEARNVLESFEEQNDRRANKTEHALAPETVLKSIESDASALGTLLAREPSKQSNPWSVGGVKIANTQELSQDPLLGSAPVQHEMLLGSIDHQSVDALLGCTNNQSVDALLGSTSNQSVEALLGRTNNQSVDALLGSTSNQSVEALLGSTNNQSVDALLGSSSSKQGIDAVLGSSPSKQGIDALLGGSSSTQGIDALLDNPTQQFHQENIDSLLESHPESDIQTFHDNAETAADETNPTTKALQQLCEHYNNQHRRAKDASHRSQELFFALYFNSSPEIVDCITVSVRQNGVLCFIPKYRLKLPLCITEPTKGSHQRNQTSNDAVWVTRQVDSKGNWKQVKQEGVQLSVTYETKSNAPKTLTVTDICTGNRVIEFSNQSRFKAMVSCNFDENPVRIPKLVLSLVLGETSNSMSSSTISLQESVLSLQMAESVHREFESERKSNELSAYDIIRDAIRTSNSSDFLIDKKKWKKSKASRSSVGLGRVKFGKLDTESEHDSLVPDLSSLGIQSQTEKVRKDQHVQQLTMDATRRMRQIAADKRNDRVKRRIKKQNG